MKIAIVLTPESEQELEQKLKELSSILAEEVGKYEVISVMDSISNKGLSWMGSIPNLSYAEVNNIGKLQKQCIARYLISKDIEGLLFLDMDTDITKEELEKRIKFLEAEQLIGVVGDEADKPDAFIFKTLFHKMLNLLNIDKKTFEKRCCNKKGEVRHVKASNLLTTVNMWDTVGGFSIISEAPYLEYCLRVQTLGYTILPLKYEK